MAGRKRIKQRDELLAKLEAAVAAYSDAREAKKQALEASKGIRRERGFSLAQSAQIRRQVEQAKEDIHKKKLEVAVLEREAEEIQERTHDEIMVYRQKVKHLMHIRVRNLEALNTDHQHHMDAQASDMNQLKRALESEIQRLGGELLTVQGHHTLHQRQQLEEAEKQLDRLREMYKVKLTEVDAEHQENIRRLLDESDLIRMNELREIQERKESHIRRLMKSHDEAYAEMKDFYAKITNDHLEQINQYEKEFAEMELRLKALGEKEKVYRGEIGGLRDRLEKTKLENAKLTKYLVTYETDKMALANTRAMLHQLDGRIAATRAGLAQAERVFSETQIERDQLLERFDLVVQDVRAKTDFRALLLDKRVENMREQLSRKAGQLEEVIAEGGGRVDLASGVSDILTRRDEEISDLEFRVARAVKAHNDMIAVLTAQLAGRGVPNDELQFRPLPTRSTTAPVPQRFG